MQLEKQRDILAYLWLTNYSSSFTGYLLTDFKEGSRVGYISSFVFKQYPWPIITWILLFFQSQIILF